ncbi:hypothetical protein D3C80_666370 [compost metagenome]
MTGSRFDLYAWLVQGNFRRPSVDENSMTLATCSELARYSGSHTELMKDQLSTTLNSLHRGG